MSVRRSVPPLCWGCCVWRRCLQWWVLIVSRSDGWNVFWKKRKISHALKYIVKMQKKKKKHNWLLSMHFFSSDPKVSHPVTTKIKHYNKSQVFVMPSHVVHVYCDHHAPKYRVKFFVYEILLGDKPASVSDCLFFFLSCSSSGENSQASLRSILEHVQSYEITYPTWLHPRRHRRTADIEVSQACPFGQWNH